MFERTIFEKIVDGDIPAYVVDETDATMAFLDANPLAPGHTLVVPKEPYRRIREMPPSVSSEMFEVVYGLAARVEDAVDADGLTVGINDGEAAGQEVPHVHVHLVPRFDDDGAGAIHSMPWDRPELSDEELDEIAEAIAEH